MKKNILLSLCAIAVMAVIAPVVSATYVYDQDAASGEKVGLSSDEVSGAAAGQKAAPSEPAKPSEKKPLATIEEGTEETEAGEKLEQPGEARPAASATPQAVSAQGPAPAEPAAPAEEKAAAPAEEEKVKIEISEKEIDARVPSYKTNLKDIIREADASIKKIDEALKAEESEKGAKEHFDKGTALYNEGKFEEAKAEWEKALGFAKGPEFRGCIKASIKRAQKKMDEAKTKLTAEQRAKDREAIAAIPANEKEKRYELRREQYKAEYAAKEAERKAAREAKEKARQVECQQRNAAAVRQQHVPYQQSQAQYQQKKAAPAQNFSHR